jgi:alpha-mannosidase
MNRTIRLHRFRSALAAFIIFVPCLIGDVPAYDLSRDSVQYVVGTSHLDTYWRWPIEYTIREYLPNTFRGNFGLFDQHPGFVFSFAGAYRYMLIKRHYPEDYERLKGYVASGNWAVSGSFVDACDVNIPSPESLIRQVLYGNGFFLDEFGKRSIDVFLPDCFGFGYVLPTVASHCGLKGFSTQKLEWGGAYNPPFDIGRWIGVDGSSIVASISPGNYNNLWQVKTDQITRLGSQANVYASMDYFGTDTWDKGGAVKASDVGSLMARIANNHAEAVKVVIGPSDQLFRDLTDEQVARLPQYRGELIMRTHGTGCYTSQADIKRRNRNVEQLARASETAAVMANHIAAKPYPADKFKQAWIRFLWHQQHDGITGTSIEEAYDVYRADIDSSRDDFAAILTASIEAVAGVLDSRCQGVPVALFNALSIDREDIVDTTLTFAVPPVHVRVFDPQGNEVPAQTAAVNGNSARVVFLAKVPATGLAIYDARPSDAPCALATGLSVDQRQLENNCYRVTIDNNGDIAGIYDKVHGRELLSAPSRLELLPNTSREWAKWELMWRDVIASPKAYVSGSSVRIVENGPARVMLETQRTTAGSTFLQRISLAAGSAGNRVEVRNDIDWKATETLLKASFPLSVSNPLATFDLGIGVIERGNRRDGLYEVPAQQWVDITNNSGDFGIAVMNDCKYGWDKASDNTLRLTLIHTPPAYSGHYYDTKPIDITRHIFAYAVYGHAGAWNEAGVVDEAERFNQPLRPVQLSASGAGNGAKTYSMLRTDMPVRVMALKKAERSDRFIVRLREIKGTSADASVAFASPLTSARETNGFEDDVSVAAGNGAALKYATTAYQPRTFSFTLQDHTSLSGRHAPQQQRGDTRLVLENSAGGRRTVSLRSSTGERARSLRITDLRGRTVYLVLLSQADDAAVPVPRFLGPGSYIATMQTDRQTHQVRLPAVR